MELTKTDRQKLKRIMAELSLFADWARFGLCNFNIARGGIKRASIYAKTMKKQFRSESRYVVLHPSFKKRLK